MMGFREALVEEMEKEKMAEKNWKVIAKRVLSNIFVLILLAGSAFAVFKAVERSGEGQAGGGAEGGQQVRQRVEDWMNLLGGTGLSKTMLIFKKT